MSKKAEELAKQLYPDPKLEDYDDILVYRADRDSAIMGRANVMFVYKQVEKDLGWHSVDESLPPVDEEVIVLRDELNGYLLPDAGFVGVGHIVNPELTVEVGDISYTPISYSGWNVDGVKYWMPMPKIPNEDE